MEKVISITRCHNNQLWLVLLVSFLLFVLFISFDSSALIRDQNNWYFSTIIYGDHKSSANTYVKYSNDDYEETEDGNSDSCFGRYIYMHDLPSRFNDDVIKNCRSLVKWFDMCPYLVNEGFGSQIHNPMNVLSKNGWFATNQFMLEIIFRDRMKKYECLTNNSSLASAIFVPFYAGLDVGRYLWGYNITVRDSVGVDLAKWLASKPEWKRMSGRDHFFISGRIGWDFHRQTSNEGDWGSKLMKLPEFMNMTMLSIETTSWSNEFGIPYPTYFHPSSDHEVLEWQTKMRRIKRPYLFSFVGAPRPGKNDSIREELMEQCIASGKKCQLFSCFSSSQKSCDNPVDVMNVFRRSAFCLQPSGDSFTRRSIFDSILAGCIPVFFHPGSAYAQYIWHLPKDYTKYSVLISEFDVRSRNISINETLKGFSKKQVLSMRKEVIRLIPNIIYAKSKLEDLEDAFDMASKGVLERVDNIRRKIEDGKDPSIGFAEENSWVSKLIGIGRENEWDRFF
ncbi:hypothetical protein HS088_TW14G00761 [Tripterygium wilfordii]|uniref:Exostosin GT47 domain-containing protein n=1 Tax=Tripterygium wilfordii TaxID=458696 RepID=A0A7J7CRW8_TRIWF|nr:probable xyloglucan galactosyltransferase GT12 [Tripterygium wilfordii]KAF5736616.1 hypothetical protein HS088_TW14G00761 [Tripterygium wilfordii]